MFRKTKNLLSFSDTPVGWGMTMFFFLCLSEVLLPSWQIYPLPFCISWLIMKSKHTLLEIYSCCILDDNTQPSFTVILTEYKVYGKKKLSFIQPKSPKMFNLKTKYTHYCTAKTLGSCFLIFLYFFTIFLIIVERFGPTLLYIFLHDPV